MPFSQNVYRPGNLNKIKEMASLRINKNEVLLKAKERAMRIKQQRDDSQIVLNLEAYRQKTAQWKAEDEAFDKLFEAEVVTGVKNLTVDVAGIEADESKKARNDEWVKGVKKDVYLQETLQIMHDMLVLK